MKGIQQTKLYKLVVNNRIVAEGNRKSMHKLCKTAPVGAFVGMGSPLSTLGQEWNKTTNP